VLHHRGSQQGVQTDSREICAGVQQDHDDRKIYLVFTSRSYYFGLQPLPRLFYHVVRGDICILRTYYKTYTNTYVVRYTTFCTLPRAVHKPTIKSWTPLLISKSPFDHKRFHDHFTSHVMYVSVFQTSVQ